MAWVGMPELRMTVTCALIMLTCVVVIVSNNMGRGDPGWNLLIFTGAGAALVMYFIVPLRRLLKRRVDV